MPTLPRLLPRLLPLLLLTACAAGMGRRPCSGGEQARVLAIGDSILAFNANSCSAIPDLLATHLDRPVHNAAHSGAQVSPRRGYLWGDITAQYDKHGGGRDLVIIEGGINDLNLKCRCGDCGAVMDSLASADGLTGDIPALVDRALADGAKVALVGYYDPHDDASFNFGACTEVLVELRARYARAAQAREGVVYVDPSAVLSPSGTPELYRNDGIHPMPDGSAKVAASIAAAISSLSSETDGR